MPSGTGLFQLPVPILLGSDSPTGIFTIPLLQFEGSGYSVADFIIPALAMEGTGAVRSGAGVFHLPPSLYGGTGLVSVAGSGQFVIPMIRIISGVTGGITGSGIFVLPMPVLHDVGLGHGIGSFVIPALRFYGEGRLIPISRIYRGVVMNLSTEAITTYSNFPFNSIAYFNGNFIGANNDGLYLLDGSTDKTMRINSKLKTGVLNLGDNFIKHIRNVWLTYRTDGHLALVIYVDEDEDHPVEIQTEIVSSKIHEERLKIPRGLRGRYYTLELKNLSGANFDIDELSLLVESIRRKVR